jgi:hypothetical protein
LSTYLGDTPDVLLSVLGREAKVLVQAEPDVVAVESVGLETKVEEVLLKGNGNGGLSRGGETGEPDGGTLLLAKIGALLASETGVPGDVAIVIVRICVGFVEGRWRGCRVESGGARLREFLWQVERTHVAIFAVVRVVWRIEVGVVMVCERVRVCFLPVEQLFL